MGIMMTPWLLDDTLIVAGLVTMLSIGLLWLRFRRETMNLRALSAVGGLYAVFAGYVGWHLHI
jgi:cation:H+ antiporter